MTVYGRQNGRGMAHVLATVTSEDRGVATCGAPILAILSLVRPPAGTVCPKCLAGRLIVRHINWPDMVRIGIPQAAKESGLALSSLQQAARIGRLETEKPSPRVRLTTRRWLQEYLDSRPKRFKHARLR